MNINGFVATILLMIGITVSPANVAGGLFWTLLFYLLAFAFAQNSGKGWHWKRACFIAAVALVMSLFSCITYQGIPLIQDMPIEGAMGVGGAIYPLWASVSPKAKLFMREVGLALIKRK